MNLTLWKKRDLGNGGLNRLRQEMDQMFDNFLIDPFTPIAPRLLREEGWLPPMDVSETDGEVTIRTEAPGIAARDLDISVTGDSLIIAGRKEEQQERKGEDYYQCERRFGSFRRVVELPETVDTDKITAESDNGVVTIRALKKPNAKPKQVEVKPVAKKVAVTG